MSENKQIRVLYIEDNAGHARLLKKRLEEKEGEFHVDWVDNDIEGLKRIKQEQGNYDVVLVDYNLRGKSGIETIRWIKNIENALPTIMITSSDNAEIAIKALKEGASNFLVKDIDHNYLLLLPTVICDTISNHRAVEEKKRAENELKRLNALLKAEQEAINSGILVVGVKRNVLRYNNRFLEIWNIPEPLLKKRDDEKILSFVSRSIKNRDAFIKTVEYLYQHPEEERSGDIIELKSGEILSRNTRPVRLENGDIIGRLWDFEDITERKKQEKLIRHMAYHDSLTGLPNRITFYDRLLVAIANAKRDKHIFAVIFIDLDRFKQINDKFGHETGDKVLQTVPCKMKEYLRESDTLSRMGGDEFLLLLPKIKKIEDAQAVTEKFIEAFQKPLEINGHEITIALSMGTSFYPQDGEEPDILVKKADDAMYRAKQNRKDN